MRIRSALLVLAAAGWCTAPVAAAQSAQADSSNARPAPDPNQRICETVSQIGSRLSSKKICATRAEWAQRRKQDRESVEEMQRLQGRPCVATTMGKGTGVAPAC